MFDFAFLIVLLLLVFFFFVVKVSVCIPGQHQSYRESPASAFAVLEYRLELPRLVLTSVFVRSLLLTEACSAHPM